MNIKVLIVDDAPFVREILRVLVQKLGCIWVGEAADGEEAVIQAKTLKPDVILMDIVMPTKSGIEATKEILKIRPHIKIIACSTLGQESMIAKAIEAGCCDYIVKPFTAADIKNKIQMVMRSAQATA